MFCIFFCFLFNILKSSFYTIKVLEPVSQNSWLFLSINLYFDFVITIILLEMLSSGILCNYLILLTNLSLRLLPSHPPQPLFPSKCDFS